MIMKYSCGGGLVNHQHVKKNSEFCRQRVKYWCLGSAGYWPITRRSSRGMTAKCIRDSTCMVCSFVRPNYDRNGLEQKSIVY